MQFHKLPHVQIHVIVLIKTRETSIMKTELNHVAAVVLDRESVNIDVLMVANHQMIDLKAMNVLP